MWDFKVAVLKKVVDGDTFDLTVSKRVDTFGFYLVETKEWTTRFRLLGLDAWEKNEIGGPYATNFAWNWITAGIGADVLRGQTFKPDNFGRWLMDIYRTDTGEWLRDALIAGGHAVAKTYR